MPEFILEKESDDLIYILRNLAQALKGFSATEIVDETFLTPYRMGKRYQYLNSPELDRLIEMTTYEIYSDYNGSNWDECCEIDYGIEIPLYMAENLFLYVAEFFFRKTLPSSFKTLPHDMKNLDDVIIYYSDRSSRWFLLSKHSLFHEILDNEDDSFVFESFYTDFVSPFIKKALGDCLYSTSSLRTFKELPEHIESLLKQTPDATHIRHSLLDNGIELSIHSSWEDEYEYLSDKRIKEEELALEQGEKFKYYRIEGEDYESSEFEPFLYSDIKNILEINKSISKTI